MSALRQPIYSSEDTQLDPLLADPDGLSQSDLADMMHRIESRTIRNAKEQEIFDLVLNSVKFRTLNKSRQLAKTPHLLKVAQVSCSESFAETCVWRALSLIRKGVA